MGSHQESESGGNRLVGGYTLAVRLLFLSLLAVAVVVGLSVEPPRSTTVAAGGASASGGAEFPAVSGVKNPDSLEAKLLTGAAGDAGARSGIAASVPLVPFPRTAVKTASKHGPALDVARAGMKRPPAGFLMSPLEYLTASSSYGYRVSPISGAVGEFHTGQDFAAPCGTRVYSADAGFVRAAGWHPWGGGNRVEIDHGNGLITTYNHLEAISVKTGQFVEVSQVIARVGTTGWSTGCHLHFETIQDGQHVDPQRWTLIPIQQLDQLENIDMVDFGEDRTKSTTANWALPATDHGDHAVLGGEQELPTVPATDPGRSAAPPPPAQASTNPETPSPSPSNSTPTGPTPTPSPTGTAAPTPSPTGSTPTPSPTGTATPSPTGTTTPSPTATPTPTGTPTPTPSPSPSPSPSPTGTTAPTTSEPTPSETTIDQIAPSPTPTSTMPDQEPAPSDSSPPAATVPYAVQPENTLSNQP